jgi:hypothetical protein
VSPQLIRIVGVDLSRYRDITVTDGIE